MTTWLLGKAETDLIDLMGASDRCRRIHFAESASSSNLSVTESSPLRGSAGLRPHYKDSQFQHFETSLRSFALSTFSHLPQTISSLRLPPVFVSTIHAMPAVFSCKAYPDWTTPRRETLFTLEPVEPDNRIKVRAFYLLMSAVGLFVLFETLKHSVRNRTRLSRQAS